MAAKAKVKNQLLDFMAQSCYYAQEHVHEWWGEDDTKVEHVESMFECTSFQMACFLSQNTVDGNGGVEWDIVMENLTEPRQISIKEWTKILDKIAKDLGGWKMP